MSKTDHHLADMGIAGAPDGPWRPAHWLEWANEEIVVYTTIHLSWRDRLRVLFGGSMELRTRTQVEAPPGLAESETRITVIHSVDRLLWRVRGHRFQAVAMPPRDRRSGEETQP